MSKLFIELEVQAVVPTLIVFANYFNTKYPCTEEDNDGVDMSAEDKAKYATYEHLLNAYNKCNSVYDDAYNEMVQKIKDAKI